MRKAFYKDFELDVFDTVYEPAEDSFLLARNIKVEKNSTVLDMGCGSGLISLIAASQGAKVTAADINQQAIENAKHNCKKYGYKINIIKSNLLTNIKGKFDYIFFNPPYVPGQIGEKAIDGGKQGREVIDEFIKQLPNHLNKKCLLVVSSHNKPDDIKAKIIDKEKLFFEELYVLEINIRNL